MAKATITATGSYKFTYDPNSKEFKEALKDYQDCIERGGSIQSMLMHVVHNVRQFGADRMVEGVGYLKVKGVIKGDPYSGIELEDGDPDYDYEKE